MDEYIPEVGYKNDKADKQTLHKIPKLTTYYGTQQPDPEVSLLQNNEMDSQEELPLTQNNPSNTPKAPVILVQK